MIILIPFNCVPAVFGSTTADEQKRNNMRQGVAWITSLGGLLFHTAKAVRQSSMDRIIEQDRRNFVTYVTYNQISECKITIESIKRRKKTVKKEKKPSSGERSDRVSLDGWRPLAAQRQGSGGPYRPTVRGAPLPFFL